MKPKAKQTRKVQIPTAAGTVMPLRFFDDADGRRDAVALVRSLGLQMFTRQQLARGIRMIRRTRGQ